MGLMNPSRWTVNDRAQQGDILLALDWLDPECDPIAVVEDLGVAAGAQRYRASLFGGRLIVSGPDLAAVQLEVEQQISAAV